MQRVTMKKEAYLLCTRKGCCAAAKFGLVEQRVIRHLEDVLAEIEVDAPEAQQDLTPLETALAGITKELTAAGRQKERLHELVELGEYDLATYRTRMAAVREKIEGLELRHEEAKLRLEQAQKYDPKTQAIQVRKVLDAYQSGDAAQRNALLHSVIERITYFKAKKTKPADFQLEFVMKSK